MKINLDLSLNATYNSYKSKEGEPAGMKGWFGRFWWARNLSVSQTWPALVQPFYVSAGLAWSQSCESHYFEMRWIETFDTLQFQVFFDFPGIPVHSIFFTWHTCRYMVMVWCGFVSRIALDICPLTPPYMARWMKSNGALGGCGTRQK